MRDMQAFIASHCIDLAFLISRYGRFTARVVIVISITAKCSPRPDYVRYIIDPI